jgi:cytochrome P450
VSTDILVSIAGADTSATIIRVILLNVLTNPRVFNRLRTEIDDGISEGRISSPITDAEARQLPYLQGCIKEALRLNPVVVGISLKLVPPEGDEVCGFKVPGGTFIGHNTWAFGRDPKIYGSDFEYYRPERWAEAPAKQLELMERNKELTFAYGRFKCLGQPVALMELNKVIVELLRRFDFAVLNPLKPMHSETHGIFLQRDFFVKATRRE